MPFFVCLQSENPVCCAAANARLRAKVTSEPPHRIIEDTPLPPLFHTTVTAIAKRNAASLPPPHRRSPSRRVHTSARRPRFIYPHRRPTAARPVPIPGFRHADSPPCNRLSTIWRPPSASACPNGSTPIPRGPCRACFRLHA